MEQGCNPLEASKKGKDANPQRAMFSRLGGLAPPEWFSLSLSLLAPSLEHVLGFPLSLNPLSFLLLARAVFPKYGNVYFTFLYLVGPYTWNVGNVCFTFLLCVIALCMMYICIYIYIYIYACVCVGDHALYMMDSRGYLSDPL